MTLLLLASWLGSLACLASYWWLTRTGNLPLYNRVTVLGGIPLVISAGVGGLYPQALLSGFYMVVACIALWRERRSASKETS